MNDVPNGVGCRLDVFAIIESMKRLIYLVGVLMASLGTVQATVESVGEEWPAVTKEMRPWVYNWWMGSSVDEAGLRLQVEEMSKVGLGGFHVIPIYSVKDDPKERLLNSPNWQEAFSMAVRLANEKGLGVDLTTGSGWCFGGPQLAKEEGAWMMEVNSKRLDRSTILWCGTNEKGENVTLSVRPTGQQVKRSGPGAHGPMMNPLSAQAMESFLKPFSAVYDQPEMAKPEHMYHDSYEYFSAGWSKELPEAFARRRGYRLEDHYAELAGVGDKETIARVKCDYRETISEVMVEEVFARWQDWCRVRGIATRNEAHGAPANWLDFYALADIPETEMFGCDQPNAQFPRVKADFLNSGDRDILISKFASSAAHVKHAGAATDPLVSAESCTWVCEHFCETPAAVKTFVDRLLLAGVNRVFYHGMCYSPADAQWPGNTFYATCEMNRFNPIWRDADLLNAYITRVQSLAQTTAIDNDVLIYWPLHDFWMDAKGFEKQLTVHARDWFGGEPIGRIARSLYEAGYSFDFISEKQLSTFEQAGSTYKTLVIPQAKAMKPATARRIFALAEKGLKVYFVDGTPTTVPGLKDVAAGEAELKRLLSDLPTNVRTLSCADFLAEKPARCEPFAPSQGLMYTRHKKNGVTYYFIANQLRDAGVKGWFKPSVPMTRAHVFDPWTGRITAVPVQKGAVELDLAIGASTILAVSEGTTDDCPVAVSVETKTQVLNDVWTRIPVSGGPEFPLTISGSLPLPWGKTKDYPESAFAGTMRYETKLELTEPAFETVTLSLGKVAESARVFVNGVEVGAVIMAPWKVTFEGEHLRKGENTIAVEVTSSGANRLKWLETEKPYPWKVFTDINMVNINYKPLDASKWPQHEYGLFGPVTLTFEKVRRSK